VRRRLGLHVWRGGVGRLPIPANHHALHLLPPTLHRLFTLSHMVLPMPLVLFLPLPLPLPLLQTLWSQSKLEWHTQ
jgi:hypothetical protein